MLFYSILVSEAELLQYLRCCIVVTTEVTCTYRGMREGVLGRLTRPSTIEYSTRSISAL